MSKMSVVPEWSIKQQLDSQLAVQMILSFVVIYSQTNLLGTNRVRYREKLVNFRKTERAEEKRGCVIKSKLFVTVESVI